MTKTLSKEHNSKNSEKEGQSNFAEFHTKIPNPGRVPFRPVHDMNNSVNTNHNERIDKCGNHPDVNPLDVESGWQ